MDVFDGALELIFRSVRGVVRELRLVGADQIRRGIDDRLVELEDRRRFAGERRGKPLDLRIEPDADQRIVALPGGRELCDEVASCHAAARREAALLQVHQQDRDRRGRHARNAARPGRRSPGRTSASFCRTSWRGRSARRSRDPAGSGSPRCGAGARSRPPAARCSRRTWSALRAERGPAWQAARRCSLAESARSR